MLHTWKRFSLFSPDILVWVSQDSHVAALAWPEAGWESRRLVLCPLHLPLASISSHLFGGGAKVSGKTLTQVLRGDAKMAFQLAGKGCLKALFQCAWASFWKKEWQGNTVGPLWMAEENKGRGLSADPYISWDEVKDEQGECEILLKIPCQPHRNNLTS